MTGEEFKKNKKNFKKRTAVKREINWIHFLSGSERSHAKEKLMQIKSSVKMRCI